MPHRKFPPPRFPIRNQQRREIDADNQQHEENGAAEQEQRVALVADEIIVQRPEEGEMAFRVVIGIRLRPVRTQSLHLRIGLLRARALAQPGDRGGQEMSHSNVR
jgi:hypothetical protein